MSNGGLPFTAVCYEIMLWRKEESVTWIIELEGNEEMNHDSLKIQQFNVPAEVVSKAPNHRLPLPSRKQYGYFFVHTRESVEHIAQEAR